MIYKKFTIVLLVIFSLIITNCKEVIKTNKDVDLSEKKTLINPKKQTIRKQEKPIQFLEKFIGRKELDIYKGENEIVWGEFYNPQRDSLLIFKFTPKNIKSRELIKYLERLPLNEQFEKQLVVFTNLVDFDILIRKIDYNYVIEQEDAGGLPVFNVKKPFKAQNIFSKNGKLIMGEIKTYQKFSEIY